MTLLALIGPDTHGVAAALAWLSRTAQCDTRDTSPVWHALLVTTQGTATTLLANLPTALGVAPPVQWPQTLDNGFHPLALGRWSLVVAVGQPEVVLPECVCHAHNVWFGDFSAAPNAHMLPGLVARLCAKHAELNCEVPPHPDAWNHWQAAGFKPKTPAMGSTEQAGTACLARYEPRWPVPVPAQVAPTSAVVIGAGLAGAAVALCLVRAGWQVCLLDKHDGPAQAASALPVGMLSAHVTARETLMSELSRTGMPLHLRELMAHVPEGQGWQRTQVTNLKGTEPDDDASPITAAAPLTLPAALVRPAALVNAWLAQAQATGRLTTQWSSRAAALAQLPSPGHPRWQVLDAAGHALAQAQHVVVTAAYGSAALLAPHVASMDLTTPLRAVKGQMTLAPLNGEPLAPHALRQHGVFVPAYEDANHPVASLVWAMGSTYERGQDNAQATPEAHARNAASLAAMHPQAHARLQAQAALSETVEWAEVRCASLDRLPLVGALPAPGVIQPSASLDTVPRVAGLWTVSALGSRGLTLSMLAAQLLVARLAGTPLPVAKRHAAALDPARFALKQARKADPQSRSANKKRPANPAVTAG